MQSSSTFIRISGPIPKVKTALINDYENAFRTVPVKRGVDEQVWFALNIFMGSEDWCHPRKTWLFLLKI